MEINHLNFRVVFTQAKQQLKIPEAIADKMDMVCSFSDQEIFGSGQEHGLVHDPSALAEFNQAIAKVVDEAGRDQLTALFETPTEVKPIQENIKVPDWKPEENIEVPDWNPNKDFQVPPFDPGNFEVPPWQPPTLFGDEQHTHQGVGVSVTDYHPKPQAPRK